MIDKKKFIILIFFLIFHSGIFAQSDSLEIPADEQIENILEESIQDADDTQMNEIIEELITNPVELNSALIDDLLRIPYIDLELANQIIQFRNKYGYYLTIGELINVSGMSSKLLNKIRQFIFIDRNKLAEKNNNIEIDQIYESHLSRLKIQYRQRFYQSFPRRKGYETGRYFNSPFKLYNRLTADYSRKYFISILSEKDPGEKSYLDFVSGSFFAKDILIFKKFVIGDYALEFGQGLSMWRQIGFAKGADAVFPIKKKSNGIVQYKSTDENQFFRGIAFTSNIWNFDLTLFFSNKSFDARIDTVESLILSTPLDGYHRNESELTRKNSAKERLLGSRLSYNFNSNQFGLNYYFSRFDKAISPNSYFKDYKTEFNYISTDFNLFYESLNLFGEITRDRKSNLASIIGLQASISRKANFVFVLRNYPAEYINIHGYGFGERNGPTNNERGFYLGLNHSFNFGTFNFYFDKFKFLFPLTYDKTLTGGKEILFAYESPLISSTKYILRYKNEIKEINSYSVDQFNRIKKVTDLRQQQNLRFEIQKFFGKDYRTAFRVEYVNVFYKLNAKSEDGFLTFGDLSMEILKNLRFKTRLTYFHTISYDTRIYQLESDVTGVFSSSALYGRGWRWYVLLNYRVFDFINLSLKYSELFRDDVKKLGSGNDEIPTNLSKSITFQLEMKF